MTTTSTKDVALCRGCIKSYRDNLPRFQFSKKTQGDYQQLFSGFCAPCTSLLEGTPPTTHSRKEVPGAAD